MPYVVVLENGGLNKYYAGRISIYSCEGVAVPSNTDDLERAKKYKYRTGAENAIKKILKESSYVSECSIKKFNQQLEQSTWEGVANETTKALWNL